MGCGLFLRFFLSLAYFLAKSVLLRFFFVCFVWHSVFGCLFTLIWSFRLNSVSDDSDFWTLTNVNFYRVGVFCLLFSYPMWGLKIVLRNCLPGQTSASRVPGDTTCWGADSRLSHIPEDSYPPWQIIGCPTPRVNLWVLRQTLVSPHRWFR